MEDGDMKIMINEKVKINIRRNPVAKFAIINRPKIIVPKNIYKRTKIKKDFE